MHARADIFHAHTTGSPACAIALPPLAPLVTPALAQTGPTGQTPDPFAIIVPVLLLMLAVVVAMVVVLKLRGSRHDDARPIDPSAALDELERTRRRGLISDEEFRAARNQFLGMASGDQTAAPARAATLRPMEVTEDGTILARPGFDLLGRRLPGHGNGAEHAPPPQHPGTSHPGHNPGHTSGPGAGPGTDHDRPPA